MNSYSAFDGDLVRPLGFVTLHAAYVEREICELIQLMCPHTDLFEKWFRQPIGWKLQKLFEQLARIPPELIPDLLIAVHDTRKLFNERNDLVHGLLFSGGRLVSLVQGTPERLVTPDQIGTLADALFDCKDRLNCYRQKQLVPALAIGSGGV